MSLVTPNQANPVQAHVWLLLTLFALIICHPPARAIELEIEAEIEDAVHDNISAHMSQLAPPEQCEVSAQFQRQFDKRLQAALQSFGYYQYEVVKLVAPADKDDCDEWELTLKLSAPVSINQLEVTLTGDGENDPELLEMVNTFPLQEGQSLQHDKYESGKAAIYDTALLRGYFDFVYTSKQLVVDVEKNSAQVELKATTGKRYRFGKLTGVTGAQTLTLIDQLRPYQPGDYYEAETLSRFIQRLKASDYFQHILARPLLEEAKDDQVPIQIIYKVKPRDLIDLGGGISSDTGLRGRITWQRPRINAAGHSLKADLFASVPEQSITAQYRIPLADPANNYLSFQAGLKARNENDTDSETFTLAAQRHWVGDESDWRKIAFLRFETERFSQAGEPKETTRLLIPGMTLSRLRLKGGVDPNWGDRQMITLETATDTIVSDIDLARLTLQSRWLRSFGDHRFTLRLELGGLSTNGFDKVPSSLRYFAGGDQSVRGFGYRSLSPKDAEGDLIGARYLYTGSVEYSYPVVDNWRAAVFTDIGNASDTLFEDPALGVGAGAVWSSPIGPVRLYIARGKHNQERTWRLHFALGVVL